MYPPFPDVDKMKPNLVRRYSKKMNQDVPTPPESNREPACLDDKKENETYRTQHEHIFFEGMDPPQKLTPLTGNGMISLRYEPKITKIGDSEDLMQMGNIKFIHKDK